MNPPGHDPLLLAGKIVTIILQAAVGIGAAALVIALPLLALSGDEFIKGIADGAEIAISDVPLLPLGGLLLIVAIMLGALFLFFGKLRAIIDTVADGDPFVPANAERLNKMAWLLLVAQLLTWPLGALALILADWAQKLDDVDIHLELNGLDLSGILMVLVLFILARVFRQGAAMRADLEGTV